MRFLVDAQLPRRLAKALADLGHDTIHTCDLPDRNATADREVTAAADHDDRIVVTKDGGFRYSYLLTGQPRRLLHVTTGNITNTELLDLVTQPPRRDRASVRARQLCRTDDRLAHHPYRPARIAGAGGGHYTTLMARFPDAVQQSLEAGGAEIAGMVDGQYARTENRSVIGIMN